MNDEGFLKLYRPRVNMVDGLQKKTVQLLNRFLLRMDNDNTIAINIAVKKKFAQELNSTVGTVNSCIDKLRKQDLILRLDTGFFMVNPYYCSYCLPPVTEQLRDKYTKCKLYPPLPRKKAVQIKEEDIPY